MEQGWWNKPVQVRLGAAGNVTFLVTNSFMAARILFEQWPCASTPKHRAARVECLSAMEGGDAEEARVAFEAAAREAGILVG